MSEDPAPPAPTPSNLLEMADSISNDPAASAPAGPSRAANLGGQGEEIFACTGVNVYFIKPEQNVATQSRAVKLRLVTIPPEQQSPTRPPAFLEAGGIIYPLIPSRSPIYRSPEGFYIFPDLSSTSPGASIGLVFPQSASAAQRESFEAMIQIYSGSPETNFPTELQNAPNLMTSATTRTSAAPGGRRDRDAIEDFPPGPAGPNLAMDIANGIRAVAEVAARGLSISAAKTSDLMDKGSEYIRSQLDPVSNPTVVPSEVTDTVNTVTHYSGRAVELSSFAMEKLTEATIKLAKFCAFYAQTSANTALTRLNGNDGSQTSYYFDQLLVVTEGVVNGVNMVCGGLRHSGKVLANALTYNTIDTVEHCYGPDAGQITEGALGTVTNVTNLGLHATAIQPRKLIRRQAKEAGQAIFIKTREAPVLDELDAIRNLNPF